MKILHTADWHIGKQLHKHALTEELQFFFDWLLKTIQKEQIDLLLISGDIFDKANPSLDDRSLYFQFLKKLIAINIKVVVTGGNHDSIRYLDAPSEILEFLDIRVIGGARKNLQEELIEIRNKKDKLELIVAAVPFLRDKDVRNPETDDQFKNRAEAIRYGIEKHYTDLADIAKKKYPNTPVIAMGHLYAKGSIESESEREIHIGNQAAIESKIFDEVFKYVALGHIHRPQIIGKNPFIRYSGSPIPLSFSEKKDVKSIVIIECRNSKITEPEIHEVPIQREFVKLTGPLSNLKEKLNNYEHNFPLPSFIELECTEENFNALTLKEVDDMVSQMNNENEKFKILKHRVKFEEGGKDTSELFASGIQIEDLSPEEVFIKRIENEPIENRDEILEAFKELLEIAESESNL